MENVFLRDTFQNVKKCRRFGNIFQCTIFQKIDFKFAVQLSKIPIYATSFSYNIVVLSLIKDNPQDSWIH